MNIFQFTWTWNSFSLIFFLDLRIVWFVSAYFSLGRLNRAHWQNNLSNIIQRHRHTETYKIWTEISQFSAWDLTCLFAPFFPWLQVFANLLRAGVSGRVGCIFQGMVRVNFRLFTRYVSVFSDWVRAKKRKVEILTNQLFPNCNSKKNQFCNFKKISF